MNGVEDISNYLFENKQTDRQTKREEGGRLKRKGVDREGRKEGSIERELKATIDVIYTKVLSHLFHFFFTLPFPYLFPLLREEKGQ